MAAQISWSEEVEAALSQNIGLENTSKTVESTLNLLADSVLQEQPALRRKKLEHLVSFDGLFKDTIRNFGCPILDYGIRAQARRHSSLD